MFNQQKAIDRIQDRLHRIETKLDDSERTIRKLDLEFGDLYDKVKRQMSRMSKRAALDAKEAANESPLEINTDEAGVVDNISAGIHARRNRGLRA